MHNDPSSVDRRSNDRPERGPDTLTIAMALQTFSHINIFESICCNDRSVS